MKVLLAATAAALVLGCAAPPPAPTPCAAEAVQLLETVPLFAGPQADAALLSSLGAGRWIYLCGAQGARREIMAPPRGERLDCSRRSALQACPRGWVPLGARTESAG
jgi:hypothetical protein